MTQSAFDDEDDKPLDPAAERVRRRLIRFMVINLGILFVAVMAVLGAIVYKANVLGENGETAAPAAAGTPLSDGAIALPAGARVVSHALSGDRLAIRAGFEDGSQAIFIYDMARQSMVARFDIMRTEP